MEEVIEDGKNGWLVDFFSPVAIAGKIAEVLENPVAAETVRAAARRTVAGSHDLERCCLPRQLAQVEQFSRQPIGS